jgi:hypothetical protein
MPANNNSPVLDGVWFRPYLLVPNTANTGATTNSTSTGNSLPPSAKVGVVGAVTNDANDWITLPSLANVPNGHEILILCNAGTNFELRTPALSNEKINNEDCDGTKEYLCSDTDIIRVIKVSNTAGWVAQSLTNLGAVRSAVVPD